MQWSVYRRLVSPLLLFFLHWGSLTKQTGVWGWGRLDGGGGGGGVRRVGGGGGLGG